MDPQLQDIVKQIAEAVDKRLAQRFGEVEVRLAERFDEADARLTKRFDEADARLTKRLDEAEIRLTQRFDAAEERLTRHFSDAEARLASGAIMHMEEIRSLVKVSAEGFGASLDSINRRLDRLEQKVGDGFADHGRILREHSLQLNQHTQLLDLHTDKLNALMRAPARRRSSGR